MQQNINFYEDFFDDKLIKILNGTELFTKTIYSKVPSVFVGSMEAGIGICHSILLANGFKNLNVKDIVDAINIEEIFSNKMQKYTIFIDQTVDFTDSNTELAIFYILETIKRGELLASFVINSDIMLTSSLPIEINSRLFEFNTIFLKTPSIEDIEIMLKNAKSINNSTHAMPKSFEMSRDYIQIKHILSC